MLVSYFNALEEVLLAKSKVASNAGHPNLRGGPRAWFVEEFLSDHIPSLLEIGQGEIISGDSAPGPPPNRYRNQHDIIIYRRDSPKISYSPNDKAYLVEGVVATLEVKSKLTKSELEKACKASQGIKAQISESETRLGLRVSNRIWVFSHIISYVVAYDGPVNISTVARWLPEFAEELGVEPGLLVDMVVVLGKGVVWRMNAFPAYKVPNAREQDVWAFIPQSEKNLYTLFTHMLTVGEISLSPPGIFGYIKHLTENGISTI